jgi:hypothetical protein
MNCKLELGALASMFVIGIGLGYMTYFYYYDLVETQKEENNDYDENPWEIEETDDGDDGEEMAKFIGSKIKKFYKH